MNVVEQAPIYLDRTSSIEHLVHEVGLEIDREVDEVGELLQTLQWQLASFHFAVDPTNLLQQAAIQQALDDCAQARAIQVRLAFFISNIQAPNPEEVAHNSSRQTAREKLLRGETCGGE